MNHHCIAAILLAVITASVSTAEPPVTAVVFSPDGNSVLTGSQAGLNVHVWPDLSLQRSLDSQLENIHDVAFSPDGLQFAAVGGTPGQEGIVELYSWPQGELVKRVPCHNDSIFGVSWSGTGELLATASLDGSVKILKPALGEVARSLTGHSRPVTSVCFLPGDELLVSAGLDQSLRVWNVETGEAIRSLNNHTRPVHDLALRPSTAHTGLPVIASVADDRTVRLWQPTIGRMVRFARLPSIPLSAAWSADGVRLIVTCRDGHVRLLDPDTIQVTRDIPVTDGDAYCLATSSDGQQVVVGGRDGRLVRITVE